MKYLPLTYYIRNKIKVQSSNEILIGRNVGLSGCTILIKGRNNRLKIGDRSRLRNMTIEIVGDDCSIEIGEQCVIGHECYLSSKEKNTQLVIGNFCMFSRNVNILTSDGHPIYQNNHRINPAQSITIGDHVWLADNVTVLKGVTIGSGTVVGIHSVVTKTIDNNCIAVGNPAREIKSDISWEI